MGRRIVLVGTLLAALVGAPRPSDAGLLEIIWEMSGPRMIGLGYGCLFTVGMKTEECRVGSAMVHHMAEVTAPKLQPFIVLGGTLLRIDRPRHRDTVVRVGRGVDAGDRARASRANQGGHRQDSTTAPASRMTGCSGERSGVLINSPSR